MRDRMQQVLELVASGRIDKDTAARIMSKDTRYVLGGRDPAVEGCPWLSRVDALLGADDDAESHTRTYTSISGCDIDVFAGLEGPLGHITGISFVETNAHSPTHDVVIVRGSIITVLINSTPFAPGQLIPLLVLQHQSEFGDCSWMAIKDMRITEYSSGISVDDITVDEVWEYTAQKVYRWVRGKLVGLLPDKKGHTYLRKNGLPGSGPDDWESTT